MNVSGTGLALALPCRRPGLFLAARDFALNRVADQVGALFFFDEYSIDPRERPGRETCGRLLIKRARGLRRTGRGAMSGRDSFRRPLMRVVGRGRVYQPPDLIFNRSPPKQKTISHAQNVSTWENSEHECVKYKLMIGAQNCCT